MERLKLFLLIMLVILLNFSNIYGHNIKAIQISYLKATNLKELEKEIIKIKEKGYNTIIFRVFHNKNDRFYPFLPKKPLYKAGVYFKTTNYPVVYDILQPVINICHKHNLKIFAWLTTRYLDVNIMDNNRKVYKFNFKKNKFMPGKGISFFNEQNVKHIKKIYSDLLKYNIDGILLQDDLKLLIDEDFNPQALKKFYLKTGIKINERNVKKIIFNNASSRRNIRSNDILKKWTNFKVNKLVSFVNDLTNYCKKIKNNIIVTMNMSYETLINPKLSNLWYSYNLKNIIEATQLDYVTIMLYQGQISKELKIDWQTAMSFIQNYIKKNLEFYDFNKIILKVQSYDWDKNKYFSKNYLNKLFTFFKKNNIENIAIFPYYKKVQLPNI